VEVLVPMDKGEVKQEQEQESALDVSLLYGSFYFLNNIDNVMSSI